MQTDPLEILFQDDHFVVIHKPPGLLVHRTTLASQATRFLLQELRDQIGRRVYPVHRLDRATSGVLLFGLSADAARRVSVEFGSADKEYLAVVRGWVANSGRIDHPVTDRDSGKVTRSAITRFRALTKIELPVAIDRYPTSRYSLVAVHPETGRRHQIRQHFKHLSHHLIGDTTYGNGKHNRYFREVLRLPGLLLLAQRLTFDHPYTEERMTVRCNTDETWTKVFELFRRSSDC